MLGFWLGRVDMPIIPILNVDEYLAHDEGMFMVTHTHILACVGNEFHAVLSY